MSSEGGARTSRRGEPRVPIEGAVRLRYRLFHDFLEENAANISSGGMFIRTTQPGERGTELDFEARLGDDFTLIKGRGEVVWVRHEGQEPNSEPGMGIRFVELEGDSRALVDKIVGERVKAGLELFDLESHAPAAEVPPEDRPAAAVPLDSGDGPIWDLGPGGPESGGLVPDGGSAAEEVEGSLPPLEKMVSLDPELPAATAPPSPTPAADSAATLRGLAPAARSRSSPGRLIAVAMISALIGAGAVLTFYWFWVQPSIDALETRIDELAGSPGGPWRPPAEEPGPVGTAASEATGEAPDGAPPTPISGTGQHSAVVDALRDWAAAWSGQRSADYLACYAASFVPPDGLSREAWEEARRARIARPQWIRVALTLVQVESTGPDTAEVRFVQSYRSARYKDLVRKTMLMVREDGAWKIAAERAVAQ